MSKHRLRRAILSVAIALLALPACIRGEQGQSRADGGAGSRITISHSGCRGSCAVYDLTLFPGGLVLYNGVRYVRTLGTARARIQPSAYQAFLLDFDRINFFSLGECALTMDAPETATTVAVRGKSKTAHHTGRCPTESGLGVTVSSKEWSDLTDLEARIEMTVNSRQWTD